MIRMIDDYWWLRWSWRLKPNYWLPDPRISWLPQLDLRKMQPVVIAHKSIKSKFWFSVYFESFSFNLFFWWTSPSDLRFFAPWCPSFRRPPSLRHNDQPWQEEAFFAVNIWYDKYPNHMILIFTISKDQFLYNNDPHAHLGPRSFFIFSNLNTLGIFGTSKWWFSRDRVFIGSFWAKRKISL